MMYPVIENIKSCVQENPELKTIKETFEREGKTYDLTLLLRWQLIASPRIQDIAGLVTLLSDSHLEKFLSQELVISALKNPENIGIVTKLIKNLQLHEKLDLMTQELLLYGFDNPQKVEGLNVLLSEMKISGQSRLLSFDMIVMALGNPSGQIQAYQFLNALGDVKNLPIDLIKTILIRILRSSQERSDLVDTILLIKRIEQKEWLSEHLQYIVLMHPTCLKIFLNNIENLLQKGAAFSQNLLSALIAQYQSFDAQSFSVIQQLICQYQLPVSTSLYSDILNEPHLVNLAQSLSESEVFYGGFSIKMIEGLIRSENACNDDRALPKRPTTLFRFSNKGGNRREQRIKSLRNNLGLS